MASYSVVAAEAGDREAANANSSGQQSMGGPTQDEVQAMCQLLGAVAVKQGLDLDKVFEGAPATTDCQDAARQAANP
ncbi:hypothetical protein ABEG17_17320 [Pedococcus sp. KACC 23699]|uniref:Uncharacterized protein n=1 Tax=Pedococcus sp. KACC 23699 TaxID=3149228 RepID=A0AAU7JSM8_9MICO